MPQITPEIQSYFDALHVRIGDAEPLVSKVVSLPDWQPALAKCHKNVDHWIAQDQRLKSVRGWLTWGDDPFGYCTFIAHSVVDENGVLYDITPVDPMTPPPMFLKHLGGIEEFDAMQPEWSWTLHPFITELSNESAGMIGEWK